MPSPKQCHHGNDSSNVICGRYVGYNEDTRKTDWGERDEGDIVDVQSDTQRQDQERSIIVHTVK